MHRRLWLFAGAAAATVLLVAASATAKTNVAGSARVSDATPAAAPFAQAWAQVPRTTAGRKAANVVVFGAEQDIDGFNTNLSCCNELWASWMGGGRSAARRVQPEREGPVVHGPRLGRICEHEGRDVHDQAERELVLGRQEGPGHLQATSCTRCSRSTTRTTTWRVAPGTATSTRPSFTHKGDEAGHVLLEDEELHRRLPRAARTRTGRASSPVSIRPSPSRAWTSTRSGRTASAVATASPCRTARTTSRTTRRARARS